jgi:hypothetical protein
VKIAFTCNGPGETAGWFRPLYAALRALDPTLEAYVFLVPDDYASGAEAAAIARWFPEVRTFAPAEYVRFALGRDIAGVPERVDRVQYLGGDLLHAVRVHARLGGVASSYKFSRKAYRDRFARVFAVDEKNRAQLVSWATPADRIAVTGNLAIDAAFDEAGPPVAEREGIVLFPGSRKGEVRHLWPFFVGIANELRRYVPGIPITFALSPFTADEVLAQSLAAGGDPRFYAPQATLVRDGERRAIRVDATGEEFAVERDGMRAAQRSRLAISIPGTKTMEFAALGVPALVVVPKNAPELATINGILQYIDRIPLIGVPFKRAAALAVADRFAKTGYFSQPNTDAGRVLHPEFYSTLFPARVAEIAAGYYADRAWQAASGAEAARLYAHHRGAAKRMAALLAEAP